MKNSRSSMLFFLRLNDEMIVHRVSNWNAGVPGTLQHYLVLKMPRSFWVWVHRSRPVSSTTALGAR
jgi:hypothetical protein